MSLQIKVKALSVQKYACISFASVKVLLYYVYVFPS